MNINLGDLPAWLATIGTIGALVAALYQIGNERKRRIVQEASDRIERHRAQARLIAAWKGGTARRWSSDVDYFIEMINSSTEPIYTIIVAGVYVDDRFGPDTIDAFFEGDWEPDFAVLNILPPGRWRVGVYRRSRAYERGISDSAPLGAELAFTDRAGVHWIRRANGGLEELSRPPFEYFTKLEPNRREFLVPEAVE